MEEDLLQFEAVSSQLDSSFWPALTELKINVLKLNDAAIRLRGHYSAGKLVHDRGTGETVVISSPALFTGEDLDYSLDAASTNLSIPLRGHLKNYNTIEDFRKADKQALFNDLTDTLWTRFTNDKQLKAVDFNPISCIAFADLKKYKYYYWFCFPAFVAQPAWQIQEIFFPIKAIYRHEQVNDILQAYADFASQNADDAACCLILSTHNVKLEARPISDWQALCEANPGRQPDLLFLDPSASPSAAGWPLRNMLTYLSVRHRVEQVRVICWRDTAQPNEGQDWQSRVVTVHRQSSADQGQAKWPAVGYEKNTAGKLSPKLADLGHVLDPKKLADQAVDLNLKLMRWRLMPSLDLEKVKQTRCLLLGAGTLGCYVARTLMAWGVRSITLVDSSTVSFSNPVRQPLFTFADSLEGGKPKAQCAAEALALIYPGVDAKGIALSIPMPGHPVPAALVPQVKAVVQQLEQLIDSHDVVYLLMDSRESRWLPTMLGAMKNKLVMNAALGFDSYLVMRHGFERPQKMTHKRLGCYYCSDITAARDSLSDATLDQMCTVTRPGLAAIASATAVELMVSVLQHPDGATAASDAPIAMTNQQSTKQVEPLSPLGLVPHQIRGFLAQFKNMTLTGEAYDKCTGCSQLIVDSYQQRGFAMLLEAFNDATTLERITGLDKMAQEMDESLATTDWEEEDEGDEF